MAMPGLTKAYIAAAAIAAFRICKPSGTSNEVVQAAAATDLSIGVTREVGAAAAGDTVDLVKSGLVDVEYGGNVTRGQELTSDADGKAIASAPGAGVNHRIIGIAEVAGAAGDIGKMMIAPSVKQGA
ncbi:MAG: DUF2190 family protein [Alphaproteobacteria bacterium]|nr:DUF2190 family protein [Alphaproteobacteria bacterium]